VTQPEDQVPADADATADDHLIAETDNTGSYREIPVNQDPTVAIASDTDTPTEVTL